MHQNSTIGCCEAKEGGGGGVRLWSKTCGEKPKRSKRITRSKNTLLNDKSKWNHGIHGLNTRKQKEYK